MSKKTKLTFRQRLRVEGEGDLVKIVATATAGIRQVADDNGLQVGELAKLCSPGEHKTLFEDMVTQLANNKEDALEALYNKQMDLIPEEKKDGDK